MRLVNQERPKEILEKIFNTKRFPSAFLFYGKEGIGKTVCALEFARGFLCHREVMWGCGECDSCRYFDKIYEKLLNEDIEDLKYFGESESGKRIFLYLKGEHPDFVYVIPDGANIKIDQIRGLKEFVYTKPMLSRNKMVIIDGADYMNIQAGNAFLKMLEEPPEDTLYILISKNVRSMLPTIVSRVFPIEFLPLKYEDFSKIVGDVGFEEYEMSGGSISNYISLKENRKLKELVEVFFNGTYEDFYKVIKEVESMDDDDIILLIELLEKKVLGDLKLDIDIFEKVMNILGEIRRDVGKGINVSMGLTYIKSIIGG